MENANQPRSQPTAPTSAEAAGAAVVPDDPADTVRALRAELADLRASHARLQELDRLKEEFVSTVTHELRAPLTSIRASSEILRDNPELDAAERARFLRIVIEESGRLTRLLDQVMDIARFEFRHGEWRAEAVDLDLLVRDAVDATRPLFDAKRVSVEARACDGPALARADRDRLMQVMINLLANAAKFAPAENGRVVVGARAVDDVLRVEVSDNGPGISLDDQKILFQRYRRPLEGAADAPHGSGLGLAISRRIVEHLGGRVAVQSEPGKGATFAFELPRLAAADAAAS